MTLAQPPKPYGRERKVVVRNVIVGCLPFPDPCGGLSPTGSLAVLHL
ncbi:MAG: hypothetical protein JWP89_3879 [Schlesneria sp.]|nr:hypothetical protein [Schlesneria sp.]